MGGLRRVFRLALLLTLLNGILAGVSSDFELMEPAESGRTMRVMVRKEFQLQPDGSYKEVSFDEKEISPKMDVDHEVAESSQPLSYLAAPYGFPTQDNEPQGSGQYYQFSPEDVKDIMSQFEATYGNQGQRQHLNFVELQTNHTASASAPSAATSGYPNFEIKKAPSQAYFLQQSSAPAQNYGSPASIQEILKTSGSSKKQPASSPSQSSHYYSPKDQYAYHYDDATGPSAGYEDPSPAYGTPTGPSESYGAPFVPTPVPEYGAPGLAPHSQWSSSYGDVKPGVGVGGVVSSLVGSVRGVGQAKAAQVSSILHQKGEVGNQILYQGGKVVQQAVQQKGEKARIIFNTLGSVPARFSEVLRNKAHVATGFLDSGSRALGAALNVKAQAAKTAGNLIAAKGKAATAVIKASGGTAADLILALGRGSARFISSSGAVATTLLNAKGDTVAKVAEALGGVGSGYGGGGHGHGHGGGWVHDGIVGGYSENEEQYDAAPSPVYDELKLQNALKSVVESPASSYGEQPQAQASLTSAFKSIYNTFKSHQPAASSSPIGSYSNPVAVSVSPPDSQEKPSIRESAESLGNSLHKMSKMFNNVAAAIDWLSPKKVKETS